MFDKNILTRSFSLSLSALAQPNPLLNPSYIVNSSPTYTSVALQWEKNKKNGANEVTYVFKTKDGSLYSTVPFTPCSAQLVCYSFVNLNPATVYTVYAYVHKDNWCVGDDSCRDDSSASTFTFKTGWTLHPLSCRSFVCCYIHIPDVYIYIYAYYIYIYTYMYKV